MVRKGMSLRCAGEISGAEELKLRYFLMFLALTFYAI
jgi:hypothetical protein